MLGVKGTTSASALIGYVELARTVGLDPLRMLDAVGIPRAALSDPDLRISNEAGRQLLELSSRAAEDFGLRLSDARKPSVLGPVALIAREQPTVRGVIEAIARHISLHTEGTAIRLEEADHLAVIRIVQLYPSMGPARQAWELTVAQIVLTLRLYLGASWRPLSVSFIHGPPKSLETHHRILGPNVDFDQDFIGFVCSRADLDQANVGADPEMARQIERFIEGLGGSHEAGPQERVRELVQVLLPTNHCTGEFVARQLGLDLRTMQRHLAAAQTSFHRIVEDVRTELTTQYLERSERPLADVSELLGFSALSAFSRWHRTRYGLSASDRRQSARA